MRFLIWLSFFLGISISAHAEKMPLLTDSTVTTTSEVLARIQSDAMALIKLKYSDLQKNYTPHFLTSGLDFDCRSGSVAQAPEAQFAGLRVSAESKVIASGQMQTFIGVSHFDCFGHLIFTERIRVIGAVPVQLSVADAVKFARVFEVQAEENSRQYQIENAQAEIVFSISSQRLTSGSGSRIYSVVEIAGAKWLELDQLDPTVNERRIYIQAHSGVFKAGSSRFRMNFGASQSGPLVLKTLWSETRIEHMVDTTISNQVVFDTILGSSIVGMSTQMLSSIFSEFIKDLPGTQQVQVGVSDSPFLRELQLNYNRMLSNTESEQVKLFLQKTIEDIKAGRIKVE